MKLLKDRDFLAVIKIFITFKILVIAVALATQFVIPKEITHTENITANALLNPFAQYDSTAYLYIAQHGYTDDFGAGHSPNYHWYPMYPLLIKILSVIGYDLAAFLIANIASFFAVMFLYLLARDSVKGKENKVVFYFLFFPTAFYMTMMYTEPLFLAFIIGSFYFARKDDWGKAGFMGFAASLTRAQGILLFLPLAYMYLKKSGFVKSKDMRKIELNAIFLLLIPLGTFSFVAYEYAVTGDPFIQANSAVEWGKNFGMPWDGYFDTIGRMAKDTTFINLSYHTFNLFLVTSFIILGILCWKKLDAEYTLYYWINLAFLLFSSNFYGMPRYLFVLFPAFMILPLLEKDRKVKYALYMVYAIFIVMMIGLVMLHVTQRFDSPLLYTPLF